MSVINAEDIVDIDYRDVETTRSRGHSSCGAKARLSWLSWLGRLANLPITLARRHQHSFESITDSLSFRFSIFSKAAENVSELTSAALVVQDS